MGKLVKMLPISYYLAYLRWVKSWKIVPKATSFFVNILDVFLTRRGGGAKILFIKFLKKGIHYNAPAYKIIWVWECWTQNPNSCQSAQYIILMAFLDIFTIHLYFTGVPNIFTLLPFFKNLVMNSFYYRY